VDISEVDMNRWSFVVVALMFFAMISTGCSGGGGSPMAPTTNQLIETGSPNLGQSTNTSLMGYYDIYFDYETEEFTAVENRTAAFTLNIVPFLNLMIAPVNGIMFENIVVYDGDPAIFGVDVDFKIFHPLAGMPQYKVYDLMGVIITNGSKSLQFGDLRYSAPYVDTFMKNPDGYTRWFNPFEFTTDLIFGWAPGGWQNNKGTANLNPYKYYSTGLGAPGDSFEFLTSGNNYDGFFATGLSRTMKIDFPLLPEPGVLFGYAIVCTWEDHGISGPTEPYHITEAIACTVNIFPDLYFDGSESGGDIIIDVDLFAWEEQPSTIKIESSVTDSVPTFSAEVYGVDGGPNVSTYHFEIGSDPFVGTQGHEVWIIAEYDGYDYDNDFPAIPHAEGGLAAFFRYDLPVDTVAPYYQLKLLQPNGFETLTPDEPYDIIWTSKNITGNINILFSNLGMALPWGSWEMLFANTADDGIETWTPTPAHITEQARIWIYSIDFPAQAVDVSNNDFRIAPRTITVDDPNGGETLMAEEPYDILWSSDNVQGLVTIELSRDAGSTWPVMVAAGTDNDGVETWYPSVADNTAQGRIRVTSDDFPTATDLSDADFAVIAPLKNLDVTDLGLATDLCVDHTTGDVLVLYDDGVVTKWLGPFYTTWDWSVNTDPNARFIDMALNGFWFVAWDMPDHDTIYSRHYSGSGTFIIETTQSNSSTFFKYLQDVVTVNSGTYLNDHVTVWGNTTDIPLPQWWETYLDRIPDVLFNLHSLTVHSVDTSTGGYGPDVVKYNLIKGAECDPAFGTIWFVEKWDWYAACFDVMNFNYQSKFFGNGEQGTDDLRINDPLDLTAGELNHMYLLDNCDVLGYRIKAFSNLDGGAITPSLEIIGITGTPLRIDGSTNLEILALISVDGSNSYLSIYEADETP
jgi:hypothetical protein